MLGADFVPAEGYGDPLRGMMALLHLARRHGVRLLRGAEVQAISVPAPVDGDDEQRDRYRRPRGECDRALGGRYRPDGRADLPVTGTVQQVS